MFCFWSWWRAVHLRMLERPKRQKLGRPLIEPQLGKELEDVDVLDDLDRVLGGEGGGAITAFPRIVDDLQLMSILVSILVSILASILASILQSQKIFIIFHNVYFIF